MTGVRRIRPERSGPAGPMISETSSRWARRAFLIACVVHLFLAAALLVPGYFVIDEVMYHWMALEAPHTGALEVRTGYREFPSPEYTHDFLPVHQGRTVPQYPVLFPLLASPLVRGFGFTGLILLNLISFPCVLWLTWRLARLGFRSEAAAWWSCGLLALGGFAWEYSLAAWPQMISLAIGTASFYCGARALLSGEQRTETGWMLAAGLLSGANLAIRIDALPVPAALLAGCLLAPVLREGRPRPRAAAALLVGCLPGLLLLAFTNHAKFGTHSPFSYGAGDVRAMSGFSLTHMIRNAWYKFVDTSAFDHSIVTAAMRRTPTGGIVYLESLKTALLQSIPWLGVLAVPIVAIFSRRTRTGLHLETGAVPGLPSERRPLALLGLPVLTLLGMMSIYSGHGGLALNQRYMLPVLPFLAGLGGWSIVALERLGLPRLARPAHLGIALATAGVFAFLVGTVVPQADRQDFLLLRWPLILAALLLVGALAFMTGRGSTEPAAIRTAAPRGPARLAGRMLGPLLAVALGWSFAVAFLYDLPRHRRQRTSNLEVARVVKTAIPPDAAFFSEPYLDPFYALIEVPGVRVLFPARDQERDLRRLADFHLAAGRPVFAVFRLEDWRRLMAGPLSGLRRTPVYTFDERYEHGPILVPRGPGLAPPLDDWTTFLLARLE